MLQSEFNLNVDAKAFLLRPDTPDEGILRTNSGGELQEPLATYARDAGLIMRRAPITPSTRLVLEATQFAKDQGAFDPFHRAAYQAFWAEGKNLGDRQILLDLGKEVGLDSLSLEHALDVRQYENQVIEQFEEAQELGIHGIPAFLVGRYLFTGVQPYSVFQRVARSALAELEANS